MMTTGAVVENIATIAGTVVLILGLYHFGAGSASPFGALMMLNINYVRKA